MSALELLRFVIALRQFEKLPVPSIVPAPKGIIRLRNGAPGVRKSGSRPASKACRSCRTQRRIIGVHKSGLEIGMDFGPGTRM